MMAFLFEFLYFPVNYAFDTVMLAKGEKKKVGRSGSLNERES